MCVSQLKETKEKWVGLHSITKPAHRPPPLLSTPRQITIKPAKKWAVHRSLTKRIPGFMIAVNTSAHACAMRKAKALAHGVAGQEASERNETGIELLLLCTNLTRNSGSDK
jgi:hypothetical protein